MALRHLGQVEPQGPPLRSPFHSPPCRVLVSLVCILLVIAAACARRPPYAVELVPLGSEGLPPKPDNCEVDILSAPPGGGYREIARVRIVVPLGMAQGKVWGLLRRSGCKAGADGLLIMSDEVETRTFVIDGGRTLEARHRVIQAVAIRYAP